MIVWVGLLDKSDDYISRLANYQNVHLLNLAQADQAEQNLEYDTARELLNGAIQQQQAAADKQNAEQNYKKAEQLLRELVESGYATISTKLNLATVLKNLIDQLYTSGWLK